MHDKAHRVAATWTPDENVTGDNGLVRPEFLWAALDCPGYFAAEDKAGLALARPDVGRIPSQGHAGEPLVVTGWPIESEGGSTRSAAHCTMPTASWSPQPRPPGSR